MNDDSYDNSGLVLTMRIIFFALITGLSTFLVVALVQSWNQPPADSFMITIVAFVFFLVTASLSFVIPPMLVNGTLKQQIAQKMITGTPRELGGLYQTQLIIGLALLEGPGLMGCIALLIEHRMIALAVPVLALGLMFARIPTANGLQSFIDQKSRELDELRLRSGSQ